MGYTGLLIRTGLYAVILAAAIWGLIRWRPKAGERKLRWVIAGFVAMVSFLMIGTVRDLFTPPITRDFEVSFYNPGSSRGFTKPFKMYATPLAGDGKSERFNTTRFEIIEGLPRYSRRNLPQGHYKMQITYYPHSRTRVSIELIGGVREE